MRPARRFAVICAIAWPVGLVGWLAVFLARNSWFLLAFGFGYPLVFPALALVGAVTGHVAWVLVTPLALSVPLRIVLLSAVGAGYGTAMGSGAVWLFCARDFGGPPPVHILWLYAGGFLGLPVGLAIAAVTALMRRSLFSTQAYAASWLGNVIGDKVTRRTALVALGLLLVVVPALHALYIVIWTGLIV
ncbi:MAG: hypothetical protein IPK81_04465 [Rhodospirillales bacterium]|nr:MAG: hypothetical protein IPK81_04465 [Rhodospirillales bacterium]